MVARVRPTNDDIPRACHDNNAWYLKFIPMVYLWLSLRPDPWTLDDIELRDVALQIAECLYVLEQHLTVICGLAQRQFPRYKSKRHGLTQRRRQGLMNG